MDFKSKSLWLFIDRLKKPDEFSVFLDLRPRRSASRDQRWRDSSPTRERRGVGRSQDEGRELGAGERGLGHGVGQEGTWFYCL